MIVALAGGVGGAKLAHGLYHTVARAPERLAVVVNTGDDFELYGLRIAPDADTVLYTLAGIANPETGWGIAGDSFAALEMMRRYGDDAWFRVGDRDLATHLWRTELLRAGQRPTEVVAALAAGDAAGARAKAQGWIYSGYKMTIFSTAEEQQREPMEIGGKVLFYPDFALRTAGGDVSVAAPWKSYVLQDRELISGQNPFSDEALLKLLLTALNGKRSEGALA